MAETHVLPAPDLPADLADVLHMLEPASDDGGFPWFWMALAAFLVFGWWRRYRLRTRRDPPAVAQPPALRLPKGVGGLNEKIEHLRSQVLMTRRYREGCHRLAALLRQRGEEVESRPLTVWTQGEIAAHLGDVPLSRVMSLLAELQFARQVPRQDDFEGVCDLAAEAGRERRW